MEYFSQYDNSTYINTIAPNNKSMVYLIVPNIYCTTVCYIFTHVNYGG